MAAVNVTNSNSISNLSGYSYISELCYGSDGDEFGDPELASGTPGTEATGRTEWDSDPDDGIDSGWCGAALSFHNGATGQAWQVNSASAIQTSVGTFNGISKVRIRAAVTNQAAMLWNNLQVDFFKNGVKQESASLASFGPDATQIPGGATKESLVTITPAAGNHYDSFTLSAAVRLEAPAGVYPATNDIYSQVLVST